MTRYDPHESCCVSGVCDRANLRNRISDEFSNYATCVDRFPHARLDELAALGEMRELVEAAIRAAVIDMREQNAWSWTAIGEELGITRQAAQKRYAS
jgi:hypothetical protein